MLFLLFQLGQDRYALEASQVAEVLPLVSITPIPQAPAGVAGICNYHGVPVPVIDVSALMLGQPAQRRLSTRILLVYYPDDNGEKHLLGFIAEKAVETVRREPTDFRASGITNDAAASLGPVAIDAHGLVQWIAMHKLLPASVRHVLFKQLGEN